MNEQDYYNGQERVRGRRSFDSACGSAQDDI